MFSHHEQGALWSNNHLCSCDSLLLTSTDASNHLTAYLHFENDQVLTCLNLIAQFASTSGLVSVACSKLHTAIISFKYLKVNTVQPQSAAWGEEKSEANHGLRADVEPQDVKHILSLNALALSLDSVSLHEGIDVWVRFNSPLLLHTTQLIQLGCSRALS